MSGHGEKLTRRQEQAIAALLVEPTIAAAAQAVEVAEATLRRWMDLPGFCREYRAARRKVVEAAVGRLQRATGKAVETLEHNLRADWAADQIKAALGILEHAFRGVDLIDLAERVEELEQRLKMEGPR